MKITVNGEEKEIGAGATLRDIQKAFSPYGEEPVFLVRNGLFAISIDEVTDGTEVKEGDRIDIMPLIIGG